MVSSIRLLAARARRGNAGRAALLLAPLLVAAIVLLQLGLAGRRHEKVVASNVEPPRLSSGRRMIDLVAVPEQQARVFNVTIAPRAGALPRDARVRVQLASAGQSRLLVVRDGHPAGSRRAALREWISGGARGAVVADGGWLDLGPVPSGGVPRRLQIVGVLPGAYSFHRLVQPPACDQAVAVELAGWSDRGMLPVPGGVRYEVVAPDPLGLAEVLARVLFFVARSRVLAVAAVIAALAFVIGWSTLDRPRHALAAFLLLSSTVLVHAIQLPPLQGADETSHVATVEGLVAKGGKYRSWWYPESITKAAVALDQDRVQHQPAEPLPLRDEGERAALAAVLASPLERELQRPGEAPPGAFGLSADSRAPAFYQLFRPLGALAPHLAIADRLALYRLGALAMALAFLATGLALLVACRLGGRLGAAYCATFTFPYAVIAMASCSNYAPAVGLGGVVGAAAVAAVVASGRRARVAGLVVMIASVWLGVAFWRDFAAGAIALTAAAVLGLPPFASRHAADHRAWRRVVAFSLAACGVLLGVAVLWRSAGGLGPQLLDQVQAALRSSDAWLYVLSLAPLAGAAALVGLDRRHRRRSPERRRRDAVKLSGALAAATVVLWLATPPTRVPYETTFLRGWAFLSTAGRTVLSTNLSWDQDRLTWKFFLGTGGWHDVFLPDGLYAGARWLTVAVLVSLPVLSLRSRLRRPSVAASLLVLAGIGATLMATSLAIRHAAMLHPYGRFALPWLGLLLLPTIARVRAGRDHVARLVLRAAVLLHLWASFVVVGLRYALGS